MKKIQELGISPWPWRLDALCSVIVETADQGSHVCECAADARLILAAPDLYEALYEAAELRCGRCDVTRYAQAGNDMTYFRETMCPKCNVCKWRDALAKAAGEEADDGEEK